MTRIFYIIGGLLVLGCTKSNTAFINDAEIWLFTGNNFDAHKVFQQDNAVTILGHPVFNPLWPTVLYIHGLHESPQETSVQVVINAYLARRGFNTLLLDWQTLADSFYPEAVANVARLGPQIGTVLDRMFDAGLELENFHLVGHSLGGQMSGYIGRKIQSMSNNTRIIPRISALDPAGPLYYAPMMQIITALSASDARFVDVIHTDAGFLGAPGPTGTVDFWPNDGTRRQFGCPYGLKPPLSEDDRCSHSRSWRYWAESVTSADPTQFLSVHAVDWPAFQKGHIAQSRMVQMGLNCPANVTGSWFLQTNGKSPFSRGVPGVHYTK